MAIKSIGKLLEDPAERARVLAHDPGLLRVWTVTEEGTTTEHWEIRREHYLDKTVELVTTLPECDGTQMDRLEKGMHLSTVAESIWGSREPGYVVYTRKDALYGGPVDARLTNGAHCHVDDHDLLYKTKSPDSVEALFASFATGKAASAERTTRQAVQEIERVRTLSAKRVPELTARLEEQTAKTHVTLQAAILARLKALEPAKKAGKTNGNGSK